MDKKARPSLSLKNIRKLLQLLLSPGAYAPITMEGNIVVDGVLASCYASTWSWFGSHWDDTTEMVS